MWQFFLSYANFSLTQNNSVIFSEKRNYLIINTILNVIILNKKKIYPLYKSGLSHKLTIWKCQVNTKLSARNYRLYFVTKVILCVADRFKVQLRFLHFNNLDRTKSVQDIISCAHRLFSFPISPSRHNTRKLFDAK